MGPYRYAFAVGLYAVSYLPSSVARRYHGFKHEAMDTVNERQAEPIAPEPLPSIPTNPLNLTTIDQCPVPSPTLPPVLTIVYPSPDAQPVNITSQSQVVDSWYPEMTWCVGPPIALVPIVTQTSPPYVNASTAYSTITAGTESCETVYAPITTTVCATTLTGLASKVTVSECDQEVTFSSECGFELETPTPTISNSSLITPAPSVKRMTTFWLAPWQSLTLGETPSDVDIKVCTVLEDETLECRRYQEVWEVVVVTQTTTTEREVQLSTTVTGPGTLLIETLQAHITDTVVFFNLTTTLILETQIEIETTSKSRKLVTGTGNEEEPTSTTYITKAVKYRSSSTE